MWKRAKTSVSPPARQPLPTAGSRPHLPPSIQADSPQPWGLAEERMANKPCPPVCHCLRGGQLGALGCEYRVLHWSAHYGSAGTVLQGIQCVAEELITEGCLRAFTPRGEQPREEIAERRVARLNLIRSTCSQQRRLLIVAVILAIVITASFLFLPLDTGQRRNEDVSLLNP